MGCWRAFQHKISSQGTKIKWLVPKDGKIPHFHSLYPMGSANFPLRKPGPDFSGKLKQFKCWEQVFMNSNIEFGAHTHTHTLEGKEGRRSRAKFTKTFGSWQVKWINYRQSLGACISAVQHGGFSLPLKTNFFLTSRQHICTEVHLAGGAQLYMWPYSIAQVFNFIRCAKGGEGEVRQNL